MLCVVGGVAIEPGHAHGPLFGTGRITMYRNPLCTVLSDDSFHDLREYEIMPNRKKKAGDKHTTAGIRWSSPTQLLISPSAA